MSEARVAIVTGSSSGIGAATALELARRGWRVVVNHTKSAQAAAEVAEQCAEAIVVQGDVAQDADCRRLVQAAIERWGRLDALVNNAGTTKFVAQADLDGLSAADFQRIFAVNVVGAFQMCRAAAQALRASRGAVVNISSVASRNAVGSSLAYAASKAALNTVSMSLARVLAPEVRVNVVAPGFVETPWMADGYGDEGYERVREAYARLAPLGSVAQPHDVAETIVWLIEGAGQVSGQILYVDGGMHIVPPRRA
jgi:3-oxoacyl-[acyl-carrier protein] reductase